MQVVSFQAEESTDRLFQGWQVATVMEGSKQQLRQGVRSDLIKNNGRMQMLNSAGEKE
jgi:hypothetical protein